MHHPISTMILSRLSRKCCCAFNLHLPCMQMALRAIYFKENSALSCFGPWGESCAGSRSGCDGEHPAWLVANSPDWLPMLSPRGPRQPSQSPLLSPHPPVAVQHVSDYLLWRYHLTTEAVQTSTHSCVAVMQKTPYAGSIQCRL